MQRAGTHTQRRRCGCEKGCASATRECAESMNGSPQLKPLGEHTDALSRARAVCTQRAKHTTPLPQCNNNAQLLICLPSECALLPTRHTNDATIVVASSLCQGLCRQHQHSGQTNGSATLEYSPLRTREKRDMMKGQEFADCSQGERGVRKCWGLPW